MGTAEGKQETNLRCMLAACLSVSQSITQHHIIMAEGMTHDRTRKQPVDEEEDPVEKMIKKSGCLELHWSVQECMAETKDWRKCQDQVTAFRKCMMKNHLRMLQGDKQNPQTPKTNS